MNIEDVFLFYEQKISPTYSFLVSITGEKPIQVLVEIENTFAHLSKSFGGENQKENITKAYNHLVRLYIDLHKLLVLEVKKIYERKSAPREIDFVAKIREAREFELKNIGNSNKKGIEAVGQKYAEAINLALDDLGLARI